MSPSFGTRYLIGALALRLVLVPGGVAARDADPDWPCQQRLVPVLSAAALWSGPPLAGAADWHSEPRVVALVEHIAPRNVSAEEGKAAIATFLSESGGDHARLATLAFTGLLEETNRQRSDLIAHIKDIAHRQRQLSLLVSQITAEEQAIPENATGPEGDWRAELDQRRQFTTRAFEGAERTVRYACETPVQLEARLGAFARALQSGS